MSSGAKKFITHTLRIERIEDASILSNFNCGVPVMDNFIHNELDAHIKKNIEGYEYYIVRLKGNVVVAFFSIKPNTFYLREENIQDKLLGDLELPIEAQENPDEYFKYPLFKSIEIEYLAVMEHYRQQRIGYSIVMAICDKYVDQYDWMTVMALNGSDYSAIGFYKKCGFYPMEPEESIKDKDNLKMCKVLNPAYVSNEYVNI